MITQYLVYVGKEEKDVIKVLQEHILSKWRFVPVQTGLRLKIGVDIPERVVKHILSNQRDLFEVEEEDTPTNEILRSRFVQILRSYETKLTQSDDTETEVVTVACIALFEVFGPSAFETAIKAFMTAPTLNLDEGERLAVLQSFIDDPPVPVLLDDSFTNSAEASDSFDGIIYPSGETVNKSEEIDPSDEIVNESEEIAESTGEID